MASVLHTMVDQSLPKRGKCNQNRVPEPLIHPSSIGCVQKKLGWAVIRGGTPALGHLFPMSPTHTALTVSPSYLLLLQRLEQ